MATLEQMEDGEGSMLGSDKHSMPKVQQIHPNIDSGAKGYDERRRRRIICAIGVTLVLLVIGLSISLGISASNDNNNTKVVSSTSFANSADVVIMNGPSGTETDNEFEYSESVVGNQETTEGSESTVVGSPTSGIPQTLDIDRFIATVDFLVRNGISAKSDLETAGTPQHWAANWMANEDPAALPVPGVLRRTQEVEPTAESVSDEEAFMTRYILALLYFSTAGSKWANSLNFLSEKPSCEWFEIVNSLPVGVGCGPGGKVAALFMSNNKLQNKLPAELSHFTNLIMLDFDVNFVTGSLPDSYQALTNLEHLHLGSTGLEGTLPSWIGNLKKLANLNVGYSRMNGPIPAELADLEMLRTIALDHNTFTGDISSVFGPSIAGLRKLQQLYLDGNGFTGVLNEDFLAFATQLEQLDISDNKLEGEIPKHLFGFEKLEVLDLHDNEFTSLPQNFTASAPLKLLALQKNNLAGPIPMDLLSLGQLTHLDLSQNMLTGEISEQLGEKLQGLTYLFLAENNFEPGPIPFTLSTLFDMQELSLKSTQRTGAIPDLFGLMTNLNFLDLDDNSFVGSIPKSLGSITTLKMLLLNRNRLQGAIPEELARLSSLKVLFLEGNNLTGGLEPLCTAVSGSAKVVAQCSLCESVADSGCCTQCCQDGEACNNDIHVADMDPLWQMGYERSFDYTLDREDWFSP